MQVLVPVTERPVLSGHTEIDSKQQFFFGVCA